MKDLLFQPKFETALECINEAVDLSNGITYLYGDTNEFIQFLFEN